MEQLTFVLEDGQEVMVPLAEHMTIGRWEDNDVVVDDERVSKHHAELVRNADGSIQLFDSNSTAGTFVNGDRVSSRTLRHGDRVSFGPLTALFGAAAHATNGHTTADAPAGDKTQALPLNDPVRVDRIATRRRPRSRRQPLPQETPATPPADAPPTPQQAEDQEAAARQEKEKEMARLQSGLEALSKELHSWQERSAAEHAIHKSRVESLRAEEERLRSVKTALQEAETTHDNWVKSIAALAARHAEQTEALQHLVSKHDQKAAEMQRLAQDEAAARHELEGLAAHRDQALAHLGQLRAETAHDETALNVLRRQIAELESRSQHSQELAEVREDQLKSAEKKLEQLSQRRAQTEAHIHELSGTEEELLQSLARCQEAEARHAALSTATDALWQEQQRAAASVKDLESRIATLQTSHQQAVAAADEARAARQQAEESLCQVQEALSAREKDLAARNAELESETLRLEEAQTHLAGLHRQRQELADTAGKLDGVKSRLATVVQQLAEQNAAVAAAEGRLTQQQSTLRALSGEESAARGRIDVLRSQEKDLRAELSRLASAERSQRSRFEEVRQLAAEAEKEHAAQRQQLASGLAVARGELAELLSRLQPLRDWKEAMDQLYARLATLPQDSPAARDLWHEIEKEKAGLHALITAARTQSHSEASGASSPPGDTARPAVAPSPPRASGALAAPGTAQETTLRSRLSHLRESVQREEARLEQLRLERTRHETTHRSSPAAEAMLREQGRHLEARIRQDQERHHALLRSIEMHQAEEEKRRERLGELEHRLADLRGDISEAERLRGDLRQQADLAHTELKNMEAAIERMSQKSTH